MPRSGRGGARGSPRARSCAGAKCWFARAASASAAPISTSTRASTRSSNTRASSATSCPATVAEAPRAAAFAPGEEVIVLPYLELRHLPRLPQRQAQLLHADRRPRRASRRRHVRAARACPRRTCCPPTACRSTRRPASSSWRSARMPSAAPGRCRAAAHWWSAPARSASATAIFARLAGAELTLLRPRPRRASRRSRPCSASIMRCRRRDAARRRREGFDLVFDATGSRASMEASFGKVAHGGTLVFVGVAPDTITFADAEFHKRETTLMASRNATLEDFRDRPRRHRGRPRADRGAGHPPNLARRPSPPTCPASRARRPA